MLETECTLYIEVKINKEDKGFALFVKLLSVINTIVKEIVEPATTYSWWQRGDGFKWEVGDDDIYT
jgi:hypothetical protein